MGHSDVFLQRVDVSKHVWAVVTVERRHIGELQQGKSCCCPYGAPTGTVGFANMLVEVVECGQCFQTELTGMALLWLISMDSLQMDFQYSQAMEVSLGAVRAGVGHFTPAPSSTYEDEQLATEEEIH